MSWRIQQLEDNRSQRVLPSISGSIGASVVRSEKGSVKPVFFNAGETRKIISIFGNPTQSNHELLEAIEYNKTYPIWLVSATTSESTYGAVAITTTGLVGIGDATAGISVIPTSMNSITIRQVLGVGSSDSEKVATIPNIAFYTAESIRVPSGDGTSFIDLTITTAPDKESFTGTGLSNTGSELQITGNNAGNLTVAYSAVPSASALYVEYTYNLNTATVLGLLISKGVGKDYLAISDVAIDSNEVFTANIKNTNSNGSFVNIDGSPITFGFKSTQKDGYDRNLYLPNVLANSEYFYALANDKDGSTVSYTPPANPSANSILVGGSVGGTVSGSDVASAYSEYENTNLYDIAVFFDATGFSTIPAIYKSLRQNHHIYTKFVLPLANADYTTTLGTTLSATDRGLFYYYGWFKMLNLHNDDVADVISTPTGEVAKNIATIIVRAFGGLSPAWVNENGMGGQLTSGRFLSEIYNLSQTQLRALDNARINPIVIDKIYGAMILSRRTSIAELNDDSFIDYSGLKDYIQKTIREQVLPYQIVKLNDSNHRSLVRSRVNNILEAMTIPPVNVIRDFEVKCDSENNNDVVLAREEFVLDVYVKITPKSRTIRFTFINTPQGVEISELNN